MLPRTRTQLPPHLLRLFSFYKSRYWWKQNHPTSNTYTLSLLSCFPAGSLSFLFPLSSLCSSHLSTLKSITYRIHESSSWEGTGTGSRFLFLSSCYIPPSAVSLLEWEKSSRIHFHPIFICLPLPGARCLSYRGARTPAIMGSCVPLFFTFMVLFLGLQGIRASDDSYGNGASDEAPMDKAEKEALYTAIRGFVGDWWNGSYLYPDPCGWTPIQVR